MMKNKRNINLDDKLKYLKFCVKTRWSDYLLIFLFSFFLVFAVTAILSEFYTSQDLNDINIIYYILCYLLFLIIFFVFRKSFKVLFFKNIYVTDGHILKKHTFDVHKDAYESPEARAISEDGGLSTKWRPFSKKYFRKKEIPVKIVIYKNMAIDFYIEDYSIFKK